MCARRVQSVCVCGGGGVSGVERKKVDVCVRALACAYVHMRMIVCTRCVRVCLRMVVCVCVCVCVHARALHIPTPVGKTPQKARTAVQSVNAANH